MIGVADPSQAPDAASLLANISRDQPLAIILAGHNGSGKSTLWHQTLSGVLQIPLINADRLTLSILPEPPRGDLSALPTWAKLLRDDDLAWQRISQAAVRSLVREIIALKVPFAYETVFSYRAERNDGTVASKADLIEEFRQAGYIVALLFVGLANSAISSLRVQTRLSQGGHAVPEQKLHTRFPRTQQVVQSAAPLADLTLMFDNSRTQEHAFTLVRAQSKDNILYDVRRIRQINSDLLAVARPWLDVVAPLSTEEAVPPAAPEATPPK